MVPPGEKWRARRCCFSATPLDVCSPNSETFDVPVCARTYHAIQETSNDKMPVERPACKKREACMRHMMFASDPLPPLPKCTGALLPKFCDEAIESLKLKFCRPQVDNTPFYVRCNPTAAMFARTPVTNPRSWQQLPDLVSGLLGYRTAAALLCLIKTGQLPKLCRLPTCHTYLRREP